MSGFVPLGVGVNDTRPATREKLKQVKATEMELINAHQDASDLIYELSKSPVLRPIVRELNARINKFLNEDEHCSVLIKLLLDYRKTIEVIPQLVEDKLKRVLGPTLVRAMDEADSLDDETLVAP